MVFIMEKELWSMQMETNMKENGLLVKSKEKVCIIGLMEIITTEIGSKIQLRDMEQLALVESFSMESFISVKSTASENKLMRRETLLKECGKTMS